MLSFGQLVEESHHVQSRVLQKPKPHSGVFDSLQVSSVFVILSKTAPRGVLCRVWCCEG